ncbi:methyltransferase domain-containing protein [Francisella sp. 19X1-34]|uniref:class I SAM-dependent methyltransferase n=1 Tax=Francisella sp. 19X1-34 TaxID=3087177 RepID=UPI002E3566F2|nr:methyltransferase domain-containing protein [Francisella sp. 19X1-34]MED7788183.1 methyltransferase domain-containing protein [Francisella sp. 19X1-34]
MSISEFSGRALDYEKYRIKYSNYLLSDIYRLAKIDKSSVIADIGAGTGLSTEMFIKQGHKVYLVEPNKDMFDIAEQKFRFVDECVLLNNCAEKMKVIDNQIDLITCMQSFHFFNNESAKKEFKRVLKHKGRILLLWHTFMQESLGFGYEFINLLKKYAKNNSGLKEPNFIKNQNLDNFFGARKYQEYKSSMQQHFTIDELIGLAFSLSYINTMRGELDGELLTKEIKDLFETYKIDNTVKLGFKRWIYISEAIQKDCVYRSV